MASTTLLLHQPRARRREESSSSGGGMGCFLFLLIAGVVVFLILKGRSDKAAVLGASKRPMGSGPVADFKFACPYPKCPNCAAPSDKMTADWDGLRKVSWKCGYCTSVAGIQELKDEELPASARQKLGLDPGPGQGFQGQGYGQTPGFDGGGVGNLLTGMMIGNMLGGSGHGHRDNGFSGGTGGTSGSGGSGDGSTGTDWGESSGGGSNWGSSDSSGGSDWGSSDSGGGDSGGGDSGGGSDW